MTKPSTFLALGLCAAVLAGCETSGGGYGGPGGRGIYEGPVRAGGAVVVVAPDRRGERIDPRYSDPRYRDGRYDRVGEVRRGGRPVLVDGRGDGRRGDGRRDEIERERGYDDRVGDRRDGRRDPCLGIPGYDPRYDRCGR